MQVGETHWYAVLYEFKQIMRLEQGSAEMVISNWYEINLRISYKKIFGKHNFGFIGNEKLL